MQKRVTSIHLGLFLSISATLFGVIGNAQVIVYKDYAKLIGRIDKESKNTKLETQYQADMDTLNQIAQTNPQLSPQMEAVLEYNSMLKVKLSQYKAYLSSQYDKLNSQSIQSTQELSAIQLGDSNFLNKADSLRFKTYTKTLIAMRDSESLTAAINLEIGAERMVQQTEDQIKQPRVEQKGNALVQSSEASVFLEVKTMYAKLNETILEIRQKLGEMDFKVVPLEVSDFQSITSVNAQDESR